MYYEISSLFNYNIIKPFEYMIRKIINDPNLQLKTPKLKLNNDKLDMTLIQKYQKELESSNSYKLLEEEDVDEFEISNFI